MKPEEIRWERKESRLKKAFLLKKKKKKVFLLYNPEKMEEVFLYYYYFILGGTEDGREFGRGRVRARESTKTPFLFPSLSTPSPSFKER